MQIRVQADAITAPAVGYDDISSKELERADDGSADKWDTCQILLEGHGGPIDVVWVEAREPSQSQATKARASRSSRTWEKAYRYDR